MSLRWIPNAISVMRILLIGPVLVLLIRGEYAWALLLFWLAGLSDGVDGWLAMRFGWQSKIGALLDPVADKLLIAGMFITLAVIDLVPAWLSAVVILRDLVIVGGAVAYHFLIEPVSGEPTTVSKLNTLIQLLFLLCVLSRATFGWPDSIAVTVLGAATLVTVVVSGLDYVLRWSGRARRGGIA
ncbi:MAG TPA: CDP-alcohol phosphatidyltransferase family protein [Woeseiaceae bacterium]|nr:CDP-alcohol phosphatidyltransferase family protein [Woeseiaceae bacterium]